MFTFAFLQHHNDSLAVGSRLHTDSLLVHQTIEAVRVPGLQVVGLLSHYNTLQSDNPPLCWQTDDYTFISLDHSDHLL